jgi:hypothetical protein
MGGFNPVKQTLVDKIAFAQLEVDAGFAVEKFPKQQEVVFGNGGGAHGCVNCHGRVAG